MVARGQGVDTWYRMNESKLLIVSKAFRLMEFRAFKRTLVGMVQPTMRHSRVLTGYEGCFAGVIIQIGSL